MGKQGETGIIDVGGFKCISVKKRAVKAAPPVGLRSLKKQNQQDKSDVRIYTYGKYRKVFLSHSVVVDYGVVLASRMDRSGH